jgi:hypothetical protein
MGMLDEPGLVQMLKFRAHNLNLAHVYPLGALTRGLQGEVPLAVMGIVPCKVSAENGPIACRAA